MNAKDLSYQYKNPRPGFNDWVTDTFLGTQNWANKDALFRQNEQNRFNEYMSNTSHQRGVQDMQKAGINPMIAYGQGNQSGASSPISGQASPGHYGSGIIGTTAQFATDLVTGKKQYETAEKILMSVLKR